MKAIGQQGEVKIFAIDATPDFTGFNQPQKDANGNTIISHSEKGHHHVVPAGVDVMERPAKDCPAGMRILYAIVKSPTEFKQLAAVPHDAISLAPGNYEFRVQREFNPFLEEARQVAD